MARETEVVLHRAAPTLLVALVLVGTAHAQRTLRVPSQHAKISGAIIAADNGDTVLVAPGLYQEFVDFRGKAIHVVSERGPRVTTIDTSGFGTPVVFKSGEDRASILEGFTVRNGAKNGMRCFGTSPTLRRLVVTANRVSWSYLDQNRPEGARILATGGAAPHVVDFSRPVTLDVR